jgi:glutaredoxin
MAQVEVYYSDMCGLCHIAMEHLTEKNIPFNKYKLKWDNDADDWEDSEASRRLFNRCGKKVDFVPQFFIDDRWISGWRELKPMIESGELDLLLEN